MPSENIKKGFERAPHRSLLKATGLTDSDIRKPFIAIANSYTDVVPGHCPLRMFVMHLDRANLTTLPGRPKHDAVADF